MSDQPISECPSDVELNRLIDDVQPIDATVSSHVATCVDCQRQLDRLTDSSELAFYRGHSDDQRDASRFLGPPTRDGDLGSLDELAIERQIGSGGMGVVFRGRDNRLGRHVAVKILSRRNGSESDTRFRRESKAAAKLNHDHIVPVYSAGRTGDGTPYLVLQLIEGPSLKERIASGNLVDRESATIIRQIALGLSAAHEHGLVHRDVKPGNVLIDKKDGRAKLTDFGLARTTEDKTLTQANVLSGTPQYMSPEQISNPGTQDPRSDIYSLGITLYECLTGSVPFRGQPIQILEQHRHVEPIRPSLLKFGLHRDLETICLKSVSKEPSRRYQTSKELADDLDRFLDGRAIHAKPVSSAELLWLWCYRNRALATSLILLSVALILGVLISTTMWFRSEQNADQSRLRLTQLEKGNDILMSIFKDFDQLELRSQEKPLDSVLAERLISAANQIDDQAIGDPLVVAKLQNELGDSLISLGKYNEANAILTKSERTRKKILGPGHPDTLSSTHNLGRSIFYTGKMDLALPVFERNLDLRMKTLGPEHQDTLASMHFVAFAMQHGGRVPEALVLNQQTLELREKHLGSTHNDTLKSMNQLANCYRSTGQIDKALTLSRQTYSLRKEVLGARHPLTLRSLNDLGLAFGEALQYEKSVDAFERAIADMRTTRGAEHPETLTTALNLAWAYSRVGKFEEATLLNEELLELSKWIKGVDHPYTQVAMYNLVSNYHQLRRFEEAIAVGQEAVELSTNSRGENHPVTLRCAAVLGNCHKDAGHLNEAIALLNQCYRNIDVDPTLSWVAPELCEAYLLNGMKREAEKTLCRIDGSIGQDIFCRWSSSCPLVSTMGSPTAQTQNV